jgi:peptidoglycan hydrolase-like protein with peptidoglycan-binding domain
MKDFKSIYNSLKEKQTLYPKFWDKNMHLKKNVKNKLMDISNHFEDYLEMVIVVSDIVLMGSIAGYNWSEYSDVDIHLVVDFSQFPKNQVDLYNELFKLKKSLYNKKYTITIYGHEVELYIQDENEMAYSSGIYSLMNNEWINKPEKHIMKVDKKLLKSKVDEWKSTIDDIISRSKKESLSKVGNVAKKYKDKLKKYRKIGLEQGGEYSIENLVFKILRRNGYIGKLIDFQNNFVNKKLSIREMEERDLPENSFWGILSKMIKSNTTLFNTKKELENYSFDENVELIQVALNFILNVDLAVDGLYGPLTENAVREFEKEYGLTVDGKLNSDDLKVLGNVLIEKDFNEEKYDKIKKQFYFEFETPEDDKSFYEEILKAIDAPVTKENMKFMLAWRQAEGATARNNPFNTTYSLDKDNGMTIYNSHKVKNYSTPQYGVEATVRTLLNPRYDCIVNNLRKGENAMDVATCKSLQTWGTGDLVIKVLSSSKLKPSKIAR